jgi:hypothetical protein
VDSGKQMPEFEDELRRSLRRMEAPEGFADRVMARVREASGRRVIPGVIPIGGRKPSPKRWIAAAVAAGVLLSAGGWRYREYQRGVKAKEQLLTALAITGSKLDLISHKVDELSQRTIQ